MDMISALEFQPNYYVVQVIRELREVVLGTFQNLEDAKEFAEAETSKYRGIKFRVRDFEGEMVEEYATPFQFGEVPNSHE